MKDKEILHLAAQEKRVVLTLDKDFQHISLGPPLAGNYGVILFRVHPSVPEKMVPIVLKTLRLELNWFGHLSIVSETAVQTLSFESGRR